MCHYAVLESERYVMLSQLLRYVNTLTQTMARIVLSIHITFKIIHNISLFLVLVLRWM